VEKTPLRETQDYLAEVLGTSAQCGNCGFRYREHEGHIIPCPRCALQRRDALLREVIKDKHPDGMATLEAELVKRIETELSSK
jgi:hypothetical protein